MVINLADVQQVIPLELKGGLPGDADVWLLDATHNAEHIGPQSFPDDGTILLPPQSATLYIFSK